MRQLIAPLAIGALIAASASPALSKGARPTAKPLSQTASTSTTSQTTSNSVNSASGTVSSNTQTGTNPNSRTKGKKVTIAVAPPSTPPPACAGSLAAFGPAATGCAGFFDKNLLDANDYDAQATALASLGFTLTGSFDDLLKIETSDATFLDFGTPLFGNTIIGIHFGNGSGVGNSTGFFEFNFTSPVSGLALNLPASSGVVLYETQPLTPVITDVPEPATWVMMLLGFGAVGFAARRARKARLLSQFA